MGTALDPPTVQIHVTALPGIRDTHRTEAELGRSGFDRL